MSMVELKRSLTKKVADYFEKHGAELACAMTFVNADVSVAEISELCEMSRR